MKNVFPEKFKEIRYGLPNDFTELLEEHQVYYSLYEKSSFLISKHASKYEMEIFGCAVKIIATALIPQEELRSSRIVVIREEIRDAFDKLSLEEINALATYYGLSKSVKEDPTAQYFVTEIEGEKFHHTTFKKIIVNAFLADVEIQLERLRVFFQYQVSQSFWYPLFDVEHEGEGEHCRIDYLVESVL